MFGDLFQGEVAGSESVYCSLGLVFSVFFARILSPQKRCVLGNWLADFLAMLPAPERYLDVGAARSSHQYLEVHPPSPGPIL